MDRSDELRGAYTKGSDKAATSSTTELASLGQHFCLDGSMPPNKKDIIVKELLKYHLIDVFVYTREGVEGLDDSVVAVPRQNVIQAAPQWVSLTFMFSVSQISVLPLSGACKDV
jgi:hypothetical protein